MKLHGPIIQTDSRRDRFFQSPEQRTRGVSRVERLGRWIFCAWLLCAVTVHGDVRTWTSVSGATVEAEFVEHQMDTVVLRTADGELLDIRLNQLSREDQIHVGSLRAPAPRAASGGGSDEPIPPAIKEAFGERLVNARGRRVSPADLQGKKIGLYFSAQWCPPCRAFTPGLVEAYEEMQKQGKPFEIIFVSHDRSENDMYKYMRDYKMPWIAIRYDDEKRDALKQQHGIRGIPSFVIVDDTGKTISANGRGEITAHGAGAFDLW